MMEEMRLPPTPELLYEPEPTPSISLFQKFSNWLGRCVRKISHFKVHDRVLFYSSVLINAIGVTLLSLSIRSMVKNEQNLEHILEESVGTFFGLYYLLSGIFVARVAINEGACSCPTPPDEESQLMEDWPVEEQVEDKDKS